MKWTWKTWANAIGGGIFGGASGSGLMLLWLHGHHTLAITGATALTVGWVAMWRRAYS